MSVSDSARVLSPSSVLRPDGSSHASDGGSSCPPSVGVLSVPEQRSPVMSSDVWGEEEAEAEWAAGDVWGCETCAEPEPPSGGGEQRARRRRTAGSLVSHARYLQYVFRRLRAARSGCWSRGGMRGLWPVFRPPTRWACRGGSNLASDADRACQVGASAEVLEWYTTYVDILRRLRKGETPTSVECFCGGGGKSEGVRRARGASHGVDIRPQPDYERRFGEGSCSRGDATSGVLLKRLTRKLRAVGVGASPPCKARSTARMRGVPQDPDLIDETRAMT